MALKIIRLNAHKTVEKKTINIYISKADNYKKIRSPYVYKDSHFNIYLLSIHRC